MGLITEDPRPRMADSLLSNADLVRPHSRTEAGTTIASGGQSLSLQRRCLVYRSVQAGHNVVNIVPLRSIDSFCIRTVQVRALLAATIVLLLLSAATGVWWYAVPAVKGVFVPNYEMSLSVPDLYVTAVFLMAAMALLFAYLVYRRIELVVHTISGNNSIQLPLSRRIAASAEAFVADVEAEIASPT